MAKKKPKFDPFLYYPAIIRPALAKMHAAGYTAESVDQFEKDADEACGKVGGRDALYGMLRTLDICEKLRKGLLDEVL